MNQVLFMDAFRRPRQCIMCRSLLMGGEALGHVCNECLDRHTRDEVRAAKRLAGVSGGRKIVRRP